MRRLGTVLVFIAAALLVAGCGGDGDTAPTTLVTTSIPPVTAPPPPKLKFGQPELAIRHLHLQWNAQDRAAAEQAASVEAVNALFSKPPIPPQFLGCTKPISGAEGSECSYKYPPGILKMHVSFLNDTWTVTSVEFQGV